MPPNLNDSSPVALITGAAKRIGAAIAQELHASGFNVIIHFNTSEGLAHNLVAKLNRVRANSAVGLQADLNVHDQVVGLAQAASDAWQRVDVLINNASSFFPTPLESSSENEWNQLINSNLKAPFFLTQALATLLKKSGGSVVNITDIYGQRPLKNHSIYSIAKAGNAMLTKSLAQELAPHVRVNGIAPGAILWPEANQAAGECEMLAANQEKILASIPLQRVGCAQDIARTVLFLCKESPYITGQIIAVDGGRSTTF